MDLSVRSSSGSSTSLKSWSEMRPIIVRPVPRPPWSILWYQNIWSLGATSSGGEGGEQSASSEEGKECRLPYLSSLSPPSLDRLHRFSMSAFSTRNGQAGSSCHHLPLHDTHRWGNYQLSEEMKESLGSGMGYSFIDEDENEDSQNSENSKGIIASSSSSITKNRPARSMRNLNSGDDLIPSELDPDHPRTSIVLDIASCDGPVRFQRINNPNFALTVEHNSGAGSDFEQFNLGQDKMALFKTSGIIPHIRKQFQSGRHNRKEILHDSAKEAESVSAENRDELTEPSAGNAPKSAPGQGSTSTFKSYLCIYCNQSFKSLFCYQKHKKRHLNPVSVDITTTVISSNSSCARGSRTSNNARSGKNKPISSGYPSSPRENKQSKEPHSRGSHGRTKTTPAPTGNYSDTKAQTKDLNVQFFPCKKCGCKFPSYYFVHKHRKTCN